MHIAAGRQAAAAPVFGEEDLRFGCLEAMEGPVAAGVAAGAHAGIAVDEGVAVQAVAPAAARHGRGGCAGRQRRWRCTAAGADLVLVQPGGPLAGQPVVARQPLVPAVKREYRSGEQLRHKQLARSSCGIRNEHKATKTETRELGSRHQFHQSQSSIYLSTLQQEQAANSKLASGKLCKSSLFSMSLQRICFEQKASKKICSKMPAA